MIRLLRKLGCDQRGNSFVEMAFITPILATLLVGAIDISDAVSMKVKTEQAAQRDVRWSGRSHQFRILTPSDQTPNSARSASLIFQPLAA